MTTETRRTRDPLSLAKTVTAALYGYIAGQGLLMLTDFMEIGWLASLPEGTLVEGLETPGTQGMIIALGRMIFMVTWLVAAFLVLKWIYRANLNARAFSPAKTVSPPWSIGWFFIPFASLWMPFRAMSETWRISDNPSGWTKAKAPSLLIVWWTLFLTSAVADNISFRVQLMAETASGLIVADWASLLGSALGIPLSFVLIKMVREISQMQAIRLEPGLAQVFS